jgi:two-component sensor histidine kinase
MPHYSASSIGFIERLPLWRERRWLGYALALAGGGVALLARMAIAPLLPPGYPYLTFLPAIAISAFLFGVGPGVACALLCGVLALYFFVPPYGSLLVTQDALFATLFFAIVCLLFITLIAWLQKATAALAHERDANVRLAETRRLLFHELQHRVSNNLQVVGALIAAQRRKVTDDAARTALDEAANRLTVIGRISRELYRPDGGRAELGDFLPHLATAVLEASGRSDIDCHFSLPPGLLLDPDRAVPLALVFTEAMANAIEHGYPDSGGTVEISVTRPDATHVALAVEDRGRGIAPGFNLDRADSVGLRIAGQLARQLGGHFSLGAGGDGRGARAALVIPA